MVALAELLRLQGEDAVAASRAPFNSSIPELLRALPVAFESAYTPAPDDVFTIVDLSDPEHIDFGAKPERVVGVVDHHLGFRDYWQERLDGNDIHIEFIGAACTQVYELWHQAGLEGKMSRESAQLLAAGILDNTLNLKAKITTERDKTAYALLAEHARLPGDWPEQYFDACLAHIAADLQRAITNDTKIIQYPSQPGKIKVGQLALWGADEFIHSYQQAVSDALGGELPWFMNFIDVKTGASTFYCQDATLRSWLENLLGVTFQDNLARAERMWLRKEIFKRALAQ